MLTATACSLELPQGESGSIPFIPIFNQEAGIQGVVLLGCEAEDADSHNCSSVTPDESILEIVQFRLPGSREDIISIVKEQTALSHHPEPVAQYRRAAFTRDLYTFETQLNEIGPLTLWLDLAMAQDDTQSYLVAMDTLPEDHDSHAAWYDTVFTHVVYALSPMGR